MNMSTEVIKELKVHKSKTRSYKGQIRIIIISIHHMIKIIDELSRIVQDFLANKKAEPQDAEQFRVQLSHIQDMFKDIQEKITFRILRDQYTAEFEADLEIILGEVKLRRHELRFHIQIFQLRILGKSKRYVRQSWFMIVNW